MSVEPKHPAANFVFPKRDFGKKIVVKRSCQADYFRTWPWLTYNEQRDVVFCHTCSTLHEALQDRLDTSDRSDIRCPTVNLSRIRSISLMSNISSKFLD